MYMFFSGCKLCFDVWDPNFDVDSNWITYLVGNSGQTNEQTNGQSELPVIQAKLSQESLGLLFLAYKRGVLNSGKSSKLSRILK